MNVPSLLKSRFEKALNGLAECLSVSQDTTVLNIVALDMTAAAGMIRPSQEPKFGDYQANMAMSLAKSLGKPPRDVAQMIVANLDVSDICENPEIAGPGFINLRLKNDWLAGQLALMKNDGRLGVATTLQQKTYVVDFSAPNVAKPMHVGHIRSTVIGNALARILRFYGHRVITDNHLGDWGTQFGMIIYGFRHFLNEKAYQENRVAELARLYRLVRKLVDYHHDVAALPEFEQKARTLRQNLDEFDVQIETSQDDKDSRKKLQKEKDRIESRIFELLGTIQSAADKIKAVHEDAEILSLARQHPDIGQAVLEETSKLHHGDPENLALWREFLPFCTEEIDRIYRRLKITFDHTLGESFYNDRLPELVDRLIKQGIARETDGAIGVFLPGQSVPMLIRKKDGAFLYATTDLATVEYRVATFHPDAILYVVDFRQSLHFEQFFAASRLFGQELRQELLELTHVKFGTVLGDDGKPFKTRSGDTVGLEGLLDEAERRALEIVIANDESKPNGRELTDEQRNETARRIGIGALVYADLSQNRESDYVFSYDKMLVMNGNTATYLQYAYARVRSIFAKGNIDIEALRASDAPILLDEPAERALALELLKFEEAIEMTLRDYRPNMLTAYLYDLANRYAVFFEQCSVLRADNEPIRNSRLLLSDLVARTLQLGLDLLGIETVERM
ncbi:MAG: arginine--tRNA ligase [Planctomycetaceae bacterium]|nr:arginine--tRNA ligase [Planctomycetaceae bacterium]